MILKNKWWGYKHTNGGLHAKRYFDERDIDDARDSPFVDRVIKPFFAENREEAIDFIQQQTAKL